jgi:hypothetical protein
MKIFLINIKTYIVFLFFFQFNCAISQDSINPIKKKEGAQETGARKLISSSKLDESNIKSPTNETIYLKLKVNSDGKIIEIKNLVNRTTTKESELINQVIKNVQENFIYSKSNNFETELIYLTVPIKAN